MLSKHFSIVIIPRKTSKVKRIRIPLFLFGIGGLILIGLLSGLVYILFDYFSLRAQLANMDSLQKIKDQQDKRIEEFNDQYQELQLHFNHLTELNDKLKSMVVTSIDAQRKSKLRREDEAALQEKIAIAKKSSVLDTIAGETSEVDSDLKYERELRFTNLISFFKTKKNPFERIPRGLPVEGYVINEFGLHTDPYTGQLSPQNGIDLAARLDFPIVAPADGVVLETRFDEDLGNVIVIDHGNGFKTLYGHLGRFEVEVGDIVKKGSVIAQVGNSGRTTGPRLYYELTFNEVPQNPIQYMYD